MKVIPINFIGRGKLAGFVASKVRNFEVLRQYVVPVNTQTARKIAVNNAFRFAADAWLAAIAGGFEQGWDDYAAATEKSMGMGVTGTLTGREWFIAINTFLLNSGQAVQQAAPATPGFAAAWAYEVDAQAGVDMTLFNVTGDLATGDTFQIQVSPPWSASKRSFDGRTTSTTFGSDIDVEGLVVRAAADMVAGQVYFVIGTRHDSFGKIQVGKNEVRVVTTV